MIKLHSYYSYSTLRCNNEYVANTLTSIFVSNSSTIIYVLLL